MQKAIETCPPARSGVYGHPPFRQKKAKDGALGFVAGQSVSHLSLPLAFRAEMRSPARNHNPPDWSLASPAWLAGSKINTVLELEEAGGSIGVDVIRHRRASQADSVPQYFAQGQPKSLEFGPGKPKAPSSRPNTGVEKAFVSIDVAYTGKQGLVEQSGFDAQPPSMEQGGKLVRSNRKRLRPRPAEACGAGEIPKLQPSKPTRIDKTQLVPAGQRKARVGVRG